MTKLTFWEQQPVKCIDCGFLSNRQGGMEPDGTGAYLKNEFTECYQNSRKQLQSDDYDISWYDEGEKWEVVGCFHRVWLIWGNSKEDEKKADKVAKVIKVKSDTKKAKVEKADKLEKVKEVEKLSEAKSRSAGQVTSSIFRALTLSRGTNKKNKSIYENIFRNITSYFN